MKSGLKKIFNRRTFKKFISISLVAAFLLGDFSIIGNDIGFGDDNVVIAADIESVDDDDPDARFQHDVDNKITIAPADFVEYSRNCVKYHKYHQNDQITIAATGGTSTIYFEKDFAGLGTFSRPFKGSIRIETDNNITLNLDAPLFNYVYDSVTIDNNGQPFPIARQYDPEQAMQFNENHKDTYPLLAQYVIHDPDGTPASWSFNVTQPSERDEADPYLGSFGGFIGTMCNDGNGSASLTLDIVMNQTQDDTGSLYIHGMTENDLDIGLICCTMQEGTSLTASLTTDRAITEITTDYGHAGGLVGSMASGSTFSYTGTNVQTDATPIKTTKAGKYAGGLVGHNDEGADTITLPSGVTESPVSQLIEGTSGSGALYGYYKPASDEIIDTSVYDIDCQVNGGGYVGGLIGVLDADAVDIEISGSTTVVSSHAVGSAVGYGGLIGRYDNSSLENTLLITDVTANPTRTSDATLYGGAIAFAGESMDEDGNTGGGSVYIDLDGFVLSNAGGANQMTFGGLIAKADNALVDAEDVTIGISGGSFKGGGLIGSLASGVLRLKGDTDISGIAPDISDADTYRLGQIVGYRNNALIFSESGWKLKRNSSGVAVDDIGSWGEVLRFNAKNDVMDGDILSETEETIGGNVVFTVDEIGHYVTVPDISTSTDPETWEEFYAVGSVADFVDIALYMQMFDSQYDGVLRFDGSSDLLDATIGLTSDIDLSGVGISTFTRDNFETTSIEDSYKCSFTGYFNGNGHTVNLSIGEPYGYIGDTAITSHSAEGFGKIYRHIYLGLFGITDSSSQTASNVTLTGNVYTKALRDNAYVGSLAGRSTGYVILDGVHLADTVTDGAHSTNYVLEGDKHIYYGGLIGQIASSVSEIDIENSSAACNTSVSNTNADSCYGGIIGWIAHNSQSASWIFHNIDVSGNITKTSANTTNKIGGLIAAIAEYSGTSQREMDLESININGLTISSAGSSGSDVSIGGMLGYSWLNVNPVFHNVQVNNGSSVTLTGTSANKGDLAGLVYNGTGYWKVEPYEIEQYDAANDTTIYVCKEGISINDITATSANARSFGMIINRGVASNSAVYLEILADSNGKKAYNIDANISTADKLSGLASGCVFDELVAYSASDGNVLSNGQGVVSVNTGFVTDGTNSSNSYIAQTNRGNVPNPNTRYYYDLDVIREGSSDPELLMRWALHLYAHSSIKTYFTTGWINGSTTSIPSGNYDMTGYSWYPVNYSGTININGTFKFYNSEFEASEQVKSAAETYGYKRTSLYDNTLDSMTQHHLMHCGLLRNVFGTCNIVGTVNLAGNVGLAGRTGSKESGALIFGSIYGDSAAEMSTFNVSGYLNLAGIKVSGISSTEYAPLLINKIGGFTTINVKNIKNTNVYQDNEKIGSSLIGNAGSQNATNINVSFSNIRLDGRIANDNDAYGLDSVYGTKSSLFTRATFLNSLMYSSGSGVYNFNLSEDWTDNGGSYSRTASQGVTYGSEISDSTTRNQYYNLEFWYKDQPGDVYTNYAQPVGTNPTDFSGFLPYVYDVSTADNVDSEKKYQIKVNHADLTMSGCGTYNDPYILTSPADFTNIVNIMNGSYSSEVTITLPNLNAANTTWNATSLKQKKWDDYGDSVYTFNSSSGKYVCDGTNGYDKAVVSNYLAGAFYKLESGSTITLPSNFKGFGSTTTEDNVFRGVIVGNNSTIILQGSYPLIYQSNGSVVKDLNIVVDAQSDITINQGSAALFTYGVDSGGKAYGAVIGKIQGGDNIIDNVTVSFGNSHIKLTGTDAVTIPVGGYVGVVIKGSLIFRGMEKYRASEALWNSISGLNSTTVKDGSNNTNLLYTDSANKVPNMKWLYVNPIVGRVINGAVFTEGDAYRPFENGTRDGVYIKTSSSDPDPSNADDYSSIAVDTQYEKYSQPVTMRNGTKNYSIADISDHLEMFTTDSEHSVPERTSGFTESVDFRRFIRIDLDIPNAQSLYIMSLVTQSGLGGSNFLERADRHSGISGNIRNNNQDYYPYNYNKPVGGFLNTGNYGISPYYKYRATHVADYSYVGNCGGGNIPEPVSGQASYADYSNAKTDNAQFNRSGTQTNHAYQHGLEAIPYIIGKYTPKLPTVTAGHAANQYDANYYNNIAGKELGYIAFSLTQQYSYLYLEFTGDNTVYYMPDGFRGLGCLGYDNFISGGGNSWTETYQDMLVHLFGIEGNGNTINLNMSLYSYYNKDKYAVANDSPGFGFIDAMMMNKTCAVGTASGGRYDNIDPTDTDYQIRNFTLTGTVRSEVVDPSNGSFYTHNSNINNNRYVSVGGLAGNVVYRSGNSHGSDIFVVSIADMNLSDLKVYGVRNTGGLLGFNKSENDKGAITYINNITTSDLEVYSGIYTGGLIGRSEQTSLDISDVTIAEPDIKTDLAFSSASITDNATGGIVGYAATSSNNGPVYLHDITIGSLTPGNDYYSYIGYTEPSSYPTNKAYETVRVGGLIGQVNTNSSTMIGSSGDDHIDYNTIIDKCNIFNVDVIGHKSGGIIGSSESSTCYIGVTDSVVKSTTSVPHTIQGQKLANTSSDNYGGAGGILGYASNLNNKFDVKNCNVSGYMLYSYKNAGGIAGYISGSDTYTAKICDTSVNGIRIKINNRAGGLIGGLNKSLSGYNILTNNIQFTSPDGSMTAYGNIVGNNGSKVIKIAGLSKQGLSDNDLVNMNYHKQSQMVGNYADTNTSRYGSGGYVIFADYEGVCLTSNKNIIASGVNDDDNVDPNEYMIESGSSTINNYPYVNTSPKRLIDPSNQYLTGDAVSKLTYDASIFAKIIRERNSNAVGAYTNFNVVSAATQTNIRNKFSTAYAEFPKDTVPSTYNFPLLVIDDNDYTAVTDMINTYINVLANTKGENYAVNNDMHRVSLNKCTYDGTQFVIDPASNSANLKRVVIGNQNYFRMTPASVDNADQNVAQFSLIDVQFLDPSDNTKVAYHLYVPVYVKKLLQFRFNAAILNGTEYYDDAYSGYNGNVVFENLGNPVTIRFEYIYNRTPAEWKDAINSGDSVLCNINKALSVNKHSGDWPSGTRMVLVDANNKDKYYYLDDAPNGDVIDLHTFVNGSDYFTAAPLNNLMTVTVGQPGDNTPRNLIPTTSDDPRAIVRSGNDYYRFIEDTEEDNALTNDQKYAVTSVSAVEPEVYYLTIFTPKNTSDSNIYHYEIRSLDKLTKIDDNDEGWRPNQVVKNANKTVGLFTGNLFTNNLTMSVTSATGDLEMNSSNKRLQVTMTSTIGLNGTAEQKQSVANNMSASSNYATIYQTFLATYDKKSSVGGQSEYGVNTIAPPTVNILTYDYYKGAGKTGTAYPITGYQDIVTENHVELRNNKNLISEISNAANGYSVTIDVGYYLTYEDPDDLVYQFPANEDDNSGVGSRVVGYSNIGSTAESATYSASSWKYDNETNRYYTADLKKATLTYNAVRTTGELAGPYSELGINPLEEIEDNKSLIHSQAQYDVSKLKEKGDYIEITVRLSRKLNYNQYLPIDTYIENMKIYGLNDVVIFDQSMQGNEKTTNDAYGNMLYKVTKSSDVYTIRVRADQVKTLGDISDGRFLFPIDFEVKTGDDLFNNNGLMYSNYRVTVEAKMFAEADSAANSYYVPSLCNDYLIYTNAKVNPEVIESGT